MHYTHTETNLTFENEYPKLVRDKIPELIFKRTGQEVATEILTDSEQYLKALLKKVTEESLELVHSETDENLQEEIADLLEVINALLELKGWSHEEITKLQNEKRLERGGFMGRILLLKKP